MGAAVHRATGSGTSGSGGRFFDASGRYKGAPGGLNMRKVGGEQFSGHGEIFRLSMPLGDRESTERPFEENPWVRAAIKAVSSGFQRLDLKFYDRDPHDEAAAEVQHPLAALLDSPNQMLTGRAFRRAHAVAIKHDGESIWFFADADGQPVETIEGTRDFAEMPAQIIPVRGKLVEVEHDSTGWPASYRYTTTYGSGSNMVSHAFPAGSVAHFRDFDPYNVTRGLGDVDGLQREIDLYFQSFRAMDASVRNGGEPGGFISFDTYIEPGELARRQELADDEYAGANQRRIKVLGDGAKFHPSGIKPSDMQYRELVEWLRDSILAGLGVPPPVVGIYSSATYNNVETAHRELWTGPNGILSLAEATADVITNDVLPRMERVAGMRAVEAAFDSSMIEALREDMGEKIDRATAIATKGIGVSFNEALEMQGVSVEAPEEGDRKWTISSLRELVVTTADAGPEEASAAPETALNGAQIAGLLSIIEQVRVGSVPKDTAVQLIVAAFPFDEARAQRILRDVVEGDPDAATEAPGGEAPGEPDDSADDSADDVEADDADDSADEEEADDADEELSLTGFNGVAFAVVAERDPDAKLHSRVTDWLDRYAAASAAHLRKISNGGLRKLNIFDENANPSAMDAAALDALQVELSEWTAKLNRETRVAIKAIWERSLKEAADELPSGPFVTTTHPSVVKQMSSQGLQLAEGVASTTAKRVRAAIMKVLQKQAPPGSLRDMIHDVLPELTEELRRVFGNNSARAATIAQTETGRAENSARYEQFEQGGVETIEWVASSDAVTRPSHAAAHGQVITVGERFTNGLRYPHDPDASAGEVVNCRCKIRAGLEQPNPFDDIDDDNLPDDQ